MRKILTEKVGWYMAVCLLLALLVGSCHQDRELELIPELTLQEKVATLVPAARNAVMGRSLSNVFSAPKLEGLKTHGKRAFTAPLPHAKLERLGWEALLIAAVDPAGRLHTAVIVRPAKRGDSYSQYGFSPEGYQQYRIEVSKGRPVKWFVPRQSSHYETVFGGNAKLKKSGSGDDGEWNCGEIDECVVYPYDHIDDDDDEDENNGGYYDPDDTNWWDDTPPRDWNDGAGGGSSGGDTGNNDRPEPTDPCENIKNMKDNAALNGKLKELMDYAKKEPIEYSYSRDNEDGHEAIIGHQSGKTYFYIEKNKTYGLLMHSHNLTEDGVGGKSIFSGQDIFTLYKLLNEGSISTADLSSFHFVVAGGKGYYGAIHISDLNKFRSFYEGYALPIHLEMDIKHIRNVEGAGASDEQLGNAFAKFLNEKDAGLTYMQAPEAEAIEWMAKEVGLNGTVADVDCN